MDKKLVAKELLKIAKALLAESVKPLSGYYSIDQLEKHYKPFGGKITQKSDGTVRVILPKQKRQYIYEYDETGKKSEPYNFKSEGYWDEHSR